MNEAKKDEWSGTEPGSQAIGNSVPNPNDFGGEKVKGETLNEETPKGQVDPAQYKELESLLGKQGEELGEYRKFFTDIAPILNKLDQNPEIVQAIIEGNITAELAKAAIEGKVSIEDAKIVDKAHAEVKRELGREGYKGASPEEIQKMIEDKVSAVTKSFEEKLKGRDEIKSFESEVNDFIGRTKDFEQYAPEIDKWLDEHNVTDIAVAYYAVKGEISEKEAQKKADIDKANAEKGIALNAGGGSTKATFVKDNKEVLDSLISSKSNPNIFS